MASAEQIPVIQREASVPFWLTPPAYWTPTHFPTSAWRTHAPFAAWIMDALRPTVVVELGTHYGYSAFAFAEAAKRLGLPVSIHALDTWIGDDHAGFYDDEVLRYVEAISQEQYPESMRLHRGLFTESRALFEDSSVDLLHVDGRHAYEDVLADYSEWKSSVREGGVVLFHDIAETEKGFGVWRLWEEIATPGRSFAFEHGHGLGVLSIGEPSEPSLRALFNADQATADRIRADFSRLGELCTQQAWLLTLPKELEQVRMEVRARVEKEERQAAAIDALQKQLDDLEERIVAIHASRSWRITRPLRALARLLPSRA
ncbi:hypothetical protein B1729_16265 [Microbacterium sp. B35-04]|uniref:class I SAM-dependent methyltransferase n=1 Tax=unclassified Microbacterium TaxID=2609290 RepID=UPI0013D0DAC5|nr:MULTISPECIES: class I SAM-dependent methyltransferase [unclassified Microbacterium]KAF2412173.1 hypothetical protein B1729_16265 [Microbacterium sp. B35-04]KAF2419966.1 hypothetical protein B2K11_03330 [Microbacterium sp. B35-30]